jgi:hypothetical protein
MSEVFFHGSDLCAMAADADRCEDGFRTHGDLADLNAGVPCLANSSPAFPFSLPPQGSGEEHDGDHGQDTSPPGDVEQLFTRLGVYESLQPRLSAWVETGWRIKRLYG